jgi:hypothetical protein
VITHLKEFDLVGCPTRGEQIRSFPRFFANVATDFCATLVANVMLITLSAELDKETVSSDSLYFA